MMDYPSKMLLLYLIRDKKEILFGRFNDSVNHEVKVNEWKNILKDLTAQGVLVGKDWHFLRNTVWQNLKRSTLLKIDNAKKAGSTEESSKLTHLDDIVLDIIGRASSASQTITTDEANYSSSAPPVKLENDIKMEPQTTQGRTSLRKRKRNETNDLRKQLMALKKAKLKLEIYNLQLDARKKEHDMCLPASVLTVNIEEICNSSSTEYSEEESSDDFCT